MSIVRRSSVVADVRLPENLAGMNKEERTLIVHQRSRSLGDTINKVISDYRGCYDLNRARAGMQRAAWYQRHI